LSLALELQRLYWTEGKTLTEIGAFYDRAPGTVWGWFQKLGVPTRSCQTAAQQRPGAVQLAEQDRIANLHAQGLSSSDIGRTLGRDGRLVRVHLANKGPLRDRKTAVRLAVARGKIKTIGRTLNESFFDVLTPESAWVLGLIFGDGHVMNRSDIGQYGVCLAGSQEVCQKASHLLNPAAKPKKRKNVNVWTLTCYSRLLVNALALFGLKGGNKAAILRMPDIPSDLLGHFLRGLWDADGHWRRVGRHVSAKLTSASEGMVMDLQNLLGGRIHSALVVFKKGPYKGRAYQQYQLQLRADETRRFSRLIYEASDDRIRCARKYALATVGVGEGR
jgi:DNA-binding CsgD family transcriptional regulator